MRSAELSQIKGVLVAMQPGDLPCVADLRALLMSDEQVEYTVTGKVKRTELIQIYTVRKGIEDERRANGRALVEGFDSTLPALERSDYGELLVHALRYPSWDFIVFTDPLVSRVLGVLCSRRQAEPDLGGAGGS